MPGTRWSFFWLSCQFWLLSISPLKAQKFWGTASKQEPSPWLVSLCPLPLVQPSLPKHFCQNLVSCCVSLQTCAGTSTHPITPNYRVICLAWIIVVVYGVLLMCPLKTMVGTRPFINFRTYFTLFMPYSNHTSHYFITLLLIWHHNYLSTP